MTITHTPEPVGREVVEARLVAVSEETFADPGKALAWLARPNRTLDGASPLSLAGSDGGVRRVEVLLGQIAHGSAA